MSALTRFAGAGTVVLETVSNAIVKILTNNNEAAALQNRIKDMNFNFEINNENTRRNIKYMLIAFGTLFFYMVVDKFATMFKEAQDSKRLVQIMEEVRKKSEFERLTIFACVLILVAGVGLYLYFNRRDNSNRGNEDNRRVRRSTTKDRLHKRAWR